ncbi:MFS transporter [Rhizobium sp. TH2]|uniref:MFS transporter n=1 Tax=Rhizobium sp. TH2 TaxID=2775403 RepID=UPI0021575CF8|nr:MFS transporter [Rhizobium sp. TH2]UVC11263.1 MFS transporter [Rhizobium sp. TH2]
MTTDKREIGSQEIETPRLRDLFTRSRTPATLLLGAGVGLEALEFYVTTSLMPSMVRDIGGLELLAWTASLFVAAIVLGSICVVIRPRNMTLNQTYITGALLFAVGCGIIGLAPNMIMVLVGRVVQGFGAGLLVTMAYSFIRFVYPPGLQNAASALYTSLWGVSVFLGPTMGGMFANGSQWRWAFLILIPFAVIMAFAAPKWLPEGEDDREPEDVPLPQILLILGAILAISFAGTAETHLWRTVLVGGGLAAIAALLFWERHSAARLFPTQATWLGHPLAKVYLVMFLVIVSLNSDIYAPYFLQTLHGVTPLVAGYLVALVALGWTAAGLGTASFQGRKAIAAIVAGTIVLSASTFILALVISQANAAGNIWIVVAISALLFGMGVGTGLGWAHLVSLVLTRSDDAEADKASASINLIQSLGAAFGAAVAGVVANSSGLVTPGGTEGAISAGFWLYLSMALPALVALFVALPLFRKT